MPARPSIVLDFLARNASLLRAARQNEQAFRRQRRFARAAGRSAARAAAGYQVLAVAVAAAAVRSGQLVRNSLDSAQALNTFSTATGVSIEQLQQLETAGARVGLVFDDVSDVIQTFTESVGLARRGLLAGTGGAQLDALRFLGFSQEQILEAERDIGGFFDRFFQRLRTRSRAEQQEILGEFSLPDAARRLLSLPDSPLRVQQEIDIPQLNFAEIARLNQLFTRSVQTQLRFERSLSRFIVRNADSIDSFLNAIERNTPAILRGGELLARALAGGADLILGAFRFIERRFGSEVDPATGEARLNVSDVVVLTVSAAAVGTLVSAIFGSIRAGIQRRLTVETARQAVGLVRRLLGSLVASLSRAFVLLGPAIAVVITNSLTAAGLGATIAATFGAAAPAILAAFVAALAAVADEALSGGAGRRAIADTIQSLFDFVREQIAGAEEDVEPVRGTPGSGQTVPLSQSDILRLSLAGPREVPGQETVSVLARQIGERLQQIEDEVARLQQEQDVALAQGQQANVLRTLERLRDLLTLRAATRQQRRELTQLGDPEFIAEAHEQFLIGLRRQIAELDQQIASASSPEARSLRAQLRQRQSELEAAEAVPFNITEFQAGRLTAIQQELREAEALALLRNDPAYRAIQRRLAQLRIDEDATFDPVIFQRERLAAIRQAIREGEALAALTGDQAFRAAQLRLSQIDIAAEGEALLRQLQELPQLTEQRRANEALRLRLAVAQARDAEAALQSQRALRLQERQAQQSLSNAQLRERVEQFDLTAPQRREGRVLENRLALLQRAEAAQERVNNLSVEYYDSAINALGDLITGVGSFADAIQRLVRDILQTTTRSFLDATLGARVFRAAAGASGSGSSTNTSAGGPSLGPSPKAVVDTLLQDARFGQVAAGPQAVGLALQQPQAAGSIVVTANIDARGGDQQSIERGLNQALPRFSRVVHESGLALLASSPVERDRLLRALGAI